MSNNTDPKPEAIAPAPEAEAAKPDTAALVTAFATAYAEAIDAADPTTYVVPVAALDTVSRAYRAIPGTGSHRADALATAAASAQATALADPAKPNTAALVAIGAIGTALAAKPAPASKPKPEVDPIESAAFALVVLTAARDRILSNLTNEQLKQASERAGFARKQGDSDAFGFMATFGPAIERIVNGKRGTGTRSESTGERKAAGTIPAHVVAVLTEAGEALSTGAISKRASEHYDTPNAAGVYASDGAIRNAIAKGEIPGVEAVMVPGERGKPVPGARLIAS